MGKLFDRKGMFQLFSMDIDVQFGIYIDSIMEDGFAPSYVPMSSDPVQTSPLDLSLKRPYYPQRSSSPSETRRKSSSSAPIFLEDIFDSPIVITEPKSEWHYRSLKDLQKKHLPYLAGIGPQRTPIRVTVSCSSIRLLHH